MNNIKKVISSLLIVMMALALAGCSAKGDTEEKVTKLSESQMQAVCELATLECYYHNTAKMESEKDVLWWSTSKKLWVEYSGIVRVGVDISKLKMDVSGNEVTITIPDAKVISCKVDESSLSPDTFYSETSGLGSGDVGGEDQSKAFAAAQEGMQAAAESDTALLLQAKLRAQTLLENYVKNIGDITGTEYTVKWGAAETEE